jgi:hypothetical protein
LRRLNLISTLLAIACLGSAACAQIVIPPDLLKKKAEARKPRPIKPTSRPAGARPDLQRMIIDFRRGAGDATKRQAAADKLLGAGPRGATLLRRIVSAELPRRTASYKKAFYSAARRSGSAKYRTTGEAKVKQWRAQFKSTGEITKESLRAKAGPAMDALLEALVPKREELLANSTSLTARREELLALESIAARCAAALELEAASSKLDNDLKQQETLLSLLGAPMSETNRKIIEEAVRQFGKLEFEEWHGVAYLNVVRTLLGLRPMKIDLKLSAAGRDHSKDMYEQKFFSHTSPVSGKKTPWDRAARQGAKARGECIAAGVASGPRSIRMWFFSPGHHKIIMSGASRVGLGGYKRRWTLMTG